MPRRRGESRHDRRVCQIRRIPAAAQLRQTGPAANCGNCVAIRIERIERIRISPCSAITYKSRAHPAFNDEKSVTTIIYLKTRNLASIRLLRPVIMELGWRASLHADVAHPSPPASPAPPTAPREHAKTKRTQNYLSFQQMRPKNWVRSVKNQLTTAARLDSFPQILACVPPRLLQ